MLTTDERDAVLTDMRNGHNVLVVTPSLGQRPVIEQLAEHVTPGERVNRSNGREGIRGRGLVRVCSTRSIRLGAGRGLTLDTVMMLDGGACQDDTVLDAVMPALIVSGGRLICRTHGAR